MGRVTTIARVLLVVALAASTARGQSVAGPTIDPARQSLAFELSRLIRSEIPLEYDKQKDWGATKEIAVGLRTEGKGFDTKLRRRKKAVEHGVWKHYKLRMIEPERHLAVTPTDLRPLEGGRVGFTLQFDAKLDVWARAKIYQYGVHLIALELEGDLHVRLAIDGEIGLRVQVVGGAPGVAVEPVVSAARLDVDDLHVRRVSDASGPIIRQLGDGVRKLVEEELSGPRLAEKLNRSIEKKRDRLVFGAGELVKTDWWPLASAQPPASAVP